MWAALPLLFCSRRRPTGRPESGRCTSTLWERACSRRRPTGRPESGGCTSTLWERACSRRRPAGRPESGGCTSTLWELARDDVLPADTFPCSFPQIPGKSPTRFSGCPSEARSLAFVGHCKFSDRVWSPGFRMAHSAARAAFLCLLNGEPCVGGLWPCRVSIPWSTNLRTVRHPSAWSQ